MAVTDIEKVFPDRSFGCVLAVDVIEHLHKNEGFRLIDSMEHIARKRVIIFTPNGFLPRREHSGNPFQVHLSGWNVKELCELRVSLLTQPFFETRPENVLAIMRVKEVEC